MDNDTLRVITLQNVGISESCIPQLSQCLSNKKFLTKLLLDGNVIGVEGAKALARGIRDNETLTNLHLSDCQIMEDGAKELSKSLENKRNLLVLDLTNNKIMSDGCVAVCKSIQTQSTLRELLLSQNFIGPGGAKAVSKVLLNKCLCLSFSSNNSVSAWRSTSAVLRSRAWSQQGRSADKLIVFPDLCRHESMEQISVWKTLAS